MVGQKKYLKRLRWSLAKRLMISRRFSILFHFVTRELAGVSHDGGGELVVKVVVEVVAHFIHDISDLCLTVCPARPGTEGWEGKIN